MSRRKKLIFIVFLIVFFVFLYGIFKPLPHGVSWQGEFYDDAKVKFIYDLTYEQDGLIVHQQNIFQKALEIIEEAEEFIVLDMFLFNDDYDRKNEFPQLANTITQALVKKKEEDPSIPITLITDEINTFYGAYPSKYLEELKHNGIEVVLTDLNALRDSNPLYSGVWNTFIRWFGTSGKGWLPNAFSPQAPKVTARSYLKLLNFKANHRKVLVTEKNAMLTSANFHDASAFHSNIAFVVEGDIIRDILASEKAVVAFSGEEIKVFYQGEDEQVKDVAQSGRDATSLTIEQAKNSAQIEVCLLTEGMIKRELLKAINKTEQGDHIWMGMFYLSDRQIINSLLMASRRGVEEINLVLDPNKDAFGLEKNGIPNRPVANELYEKSDGKIKIRWYKTHGEQFHTKLTFIKNKEKSIIIGGSANLTKRNISNYNLEANLAIYADNESLLVSDIENYFQQIWSNKKGIYTVDLEVYREKSTWKRLLYLFQEFTGFSTV
ncbi:MAG: phospholipase D family protein [Peptococcia bacterium]|jgi:phosphatidylserine/phosphatidylglycerophosphate/cardiolipin synthase-like enzyme